MNQTTLTGLAMLLAAPAFAGVADPRFSSVDPAIVASRTLANGFHVTVRFVDNSPAPNRVVTLDFSGTNIRLDAVQPAGVTLNCAAHTASAVANRMGQVDIALGFSGSSNGAVIPVDADRVVLGHIWARSTDFNGDGATDLADLPIFAAAFGGMHPEADFDNSGGTIGLGDLAVFAREYDSGAQGSPCP